MLCNTKLFKNKIIQIFCALKHSVINNNFSPTGNSLLSTLYETAYLFKKTLSDISKIIVPHSLHQHQQVLNLAHEGHRGVTKQRLHSYVWWPGMSAKVKKHIRTIQPLSQEVYPDCCS